MNQLRPHGRELIEAARRERTPSSEQRERLLSELLAAADPGPASGTSGGRRKLSDVQKAIALVALAMALGLVLYAAGHLGR
jgi:hypothetical protein